MQEGNNTSMDQKRLKTGVFFALGAYTTWGALPIFWRQLAEFGPLLIMAYRIFTLFILIVIAILALKGWSDLKTVFYDRHKFNWTLVSAVAITVNWSAFIVAVTGDNVLQASMANFLTPAFIILTGIIILKEDILPGQIAALFMAITGLAVLLVGSGEFPYIALIMGSSLTMYGLSKRKAKLKTMTAMFWETALTAPICLIYIIYAEYTGIPGLLTASGTFVIVLLLLSGLATGLPILFYTLGNDRIPFVWMGVCQFISPTLMFLQAWLLYNEPLTAIRLAAFICIWISVAIFIWSIYRNSNIQPEQSPSAEHQDPSPDSRN